MLVFSFRLVCNFMRSTVARFNFADFGLFQRTRNVRFKGRPLGSPGIQTGRTFGTIGKTPQNQVFLRVFQRRNQK